MGITIKEVAREAGVSVATVSRVINDSGPVNEATRRRVERAARALRYVPHGAARSLITSKTITLGVLLPDLFGEFFSEVIRGIDQRAQRDGYHILVSSSHRKKSDIEAALQAMSGRVDGLLVMSPDLSIDALQANLPEALPVVLLNCEVKGMQYDTLNIDNFGGALAMSRHLLALGHERIAFVRGASGNHDADERLRGYRVATQEAGMWEAALELDGDFSQASGHEAVRQALAMSPRPSALFAANDAMAIGALSALREAGVDVPGEVAVTGFDDIPISKYLSPPLTTVRVGISELGAQATARLIEAVEENGNRTKRKETAPTHLVVRRSCGMHPENSP